MLIGLEADREWILYDVGGARSLVCHMWYDPQFRRDVLTPGLQRHAWYPYFDDVNALIFLAPISCFDERLAEDRRVNRLQDSLLLWKAVCSSQLLAKVQLILVRRAVQIVPRTVIRRTLPQFLNKCDLLEKKIERGVQVSRYITSYGTRPNEASAVAKCELY